MIELLKTSLSVSHMMTAHPITQNPQQVSNLWQRAHSQKLFCGLQQNEKDFNFYFLWFIELQHCHQDPGN